MQVCTSLQTDNHASTPPLCFYRPDALPAAQPTASKHWRQTQWKWKSQGRIAAVRICQVVPIWFLEATRVYHANCIPIGSINRTTLTPVSTHFRLSANLSLVLPFRYRLTQVVLEKRPLNRCCTVVVIVVIIYNQCSLVNHCYATDLHSNDGGCL